MDEKKKRKLIKRYFKSKGVPLVTILIGVVGVSMIVFGEDESLLGFGILFVFLFIILITIKLLRRGPSHEQIDEWLHEDLSRLPKLALNKLDLDEDDLVTDQLQLVAPVMWATHGVPNDELLFKAEKKGKKRKARYAIHHVTVILLTDSHLGAYTADFNFLRNTYLNELAQEVHYQDVVSVSLREDSTNLSLADGQKAVHGQQFRLSFSSGEHISVVVQSRELRDLTGAEQDTSDAENVVTAIRKMLREKKSQAVNSGDS